MMGRGFPLGLSMQVMGEEGKVILAAESSMLTVPHLLWYTLTLITVSSLLRASIIRSHSYSLSTRSKGVCTCSDKLLKEGTFAAIITNPTSSLSWLHAHESHYMSRDFPLPAKPKVRGQIQAIVLFYWS